MIVLVWSLAAVAVLAAALTPSSSSEDRSASPDAPADADAASAPPSSGLPHEVLDAVDVGAVVAAGDEVVYANAVAATLLDTESIAPGDPVPATCHSALRALPHSDTEATVTRRVDVNGQTRTLRLTASYLSASTDRGTRLRLVRIRDVTETEETREALRSQHGLLEAIMQTSVAAVAVVNAQGKVVYANERAQEVLSLERTGPSSWTYRHLDWTVTHLGTGEDETGSDEVFEERSRGELPLQQVLDTGEPIRDLQCRVAWPDGTEKFVSIHAAPLDDPDGAPRVVFSVDDITQRIRAERRLQREKRFSEAAINSLPGIFYMVDRNGRNRRWNRNLETLTGYSAEELEGRPLSDLFASSEQSEVRSDISSVFRTGRFSIEADVEAKDGTTIPHVFTGTAVEIEGTPYLVGMGLDISEQKRRERELREAKETAEEAKAEAEEARQEAEKMNRLKSAFLANMSHEIRTPLTGIIGSADVLKEELPEEKHQLVNHIATGAHRLKNTLDAVLEISKLEAEARSLHPEPIDVVQEVTDTVDVMRSAASEAGVDLRASISPESWTCMLDSSALSSILTNLIHNAIKFTPEGGTVTVDLPTPQGSDSTGEEIGRGDDEDDRPVLVVRVIDTGVGIREEVQEEIFEPFTQESVGDDREHEGSGLGLAITRHLVELMDGSIELHSKKSEGTTFEVRLPVTTGDGGDADSSDPDAAVPGR